MPEKITRAEMREILIKEHGQIFIHEDQKNLPRISPRILEEVTLPGKVWSAASNLRQLRRFPRMEMITDNFVSHDDREIWRRMLQKDYGRVFEDVYFYNNKFRLSNISTVGQAITNLMRTINLERAGDLYQRVDDIWEGIKPPRPDITYTEQDLRTLNEMVRRLNKGAPIGINILNAGLALGGRIEEAQEEMEEKEYEKSSLGEKIERVIKTEKAAIEAVRLYSTESPFLRTH